MTTYEQQVLQNQFCGAHARARAHARACARARARACARARAHVALRQSTC